MKMNEIIDQTEDVDNLKFDSKKSYPQIKYKKSFSTHISDKTQQTILEKNNSNSLFPFQPNFKNIPHPNYLILFNLLDLKNQIFHQVRCF